MIASRRTVSSLDQTILPHQPPISLIQLKLQLSLVNLTRLALKNQIRIYCEKPWLIILFKLKMSSATQLSKLSCQVLVKPKPCCHLHKLILLLVLLKSLNLLKSTRQSRQICKKSKVPKLSTNMQALRRTKLVY